MASPLEDVTNMNDRTPSQQLISEYEVTSYTTSTPADSDSEPPSSPFVANVSDDRDRENRSPSKHTRMASVDIEQATSPLKMFKSRTSPNLSQSPQKVPDSMRSPRKVSSPIKRFPVKPSAPSVPSPERQPIVEEKTLSIEEVLRDNEGLTKAIAILEDDSSSHGELDDTLTSMSGSHEEVPNMVRVILFLNTVSQYVAHF